MIQVDNTEHKDENVEAEKDTDIAITKVTSSEELQLEEMADIFENLVIGKTLISLFCQFHAIVQVILEHVVCNCSSYIGFQVTISRELP